MAYFPHAYQKLLLASNATPVLDGTPGTTLTTALLKGQLGIINAADNTVQDLNATPTYAAIPMIYLAQGSFYQNDKLGPFHGGYQETVKSKGINPKYISKMWKTTSAEAVASLLQVSTGVDAECIACNTTYYLRLDVKGSPALRTLTHNGYLTIPAFTGCCDDTNSNVDPNVVNLAWADYINNNPTMNNFVLATAFNFVVGTTSTAANALSTTTTTAVFDLTAYTSVALGQRVTGTNVPAGAVVTNINGTTSVTITFPAVATAPAVADFNAIADLKFYGAIATATYTVETGAAADTNDGMLIIESAYVDTQFGDCSFDPKDHFELEPVQLYASITDESGDPCATACFTITNLAIASQGKGYGETILREMIQFKRYRQEDFKTDPRLREVLGETVLEAIDRAVKYSAYYILHSVPRKSNPSGMMDNDQYLIKIALPDSVFGHASVAQFETWIEALCTSAGNPLVFETLA